MNKLWFLVLCIPLLVPTIAPAAEEVLVDKYFIDRECKNLSKAANSTLDTQVTGICGMRQRNLLTPSEWLRKRNALAKKINEASAGCDECDSKYLEDKYTEVPSGYEIYTLFLLPEKSLAEGSNEVLRDRFKRFGESIGPKQAAIWLGDTSGRVDIEHAKVYCKLLDLAYYDGPYIVTSRVRPSELTPDSEMMLIKLNSVSVDGTIRILLRLEQELSEDRVPGKALVWAELMERVSYIASKYDPISLLKWAAN